MENNITPIFGRLKNVSKENPYVAGAVDIKDDVKNKNQQTINQETDEHLSAHDAHLETHDDHLETHDTEIADRYTKEEVNNIVSRTPDTDVIVIEVPAASQSDIAGWLDANTPSGTDPETGISVRANKLYRVPGPNNTTYSEWAWDGTKYIMLANKDYGIDVVPTAGSNNLVKSGGVYRSLKKVSEIDKEKINNKDENIIVKSSNNETIVSISEDGVDCKNLKSNGIDVLGYADSKTKNIEQNDASSYDDSIEFTTNKGKVVARIDKEGLKTKNLFQDKTNSFIDSVDFVNKDGAVVVRISEDGIECDKLRIRNGSINSNSSNTDAIYLRNYIKDNYIVEGKSLYFNLPEYPTSFEEDGYIDNKIKNIPKGKHFIFITDTHWETSSKNTNYLANYVKKRLGINKVVFGGDVLNEYHTHNGSSYASHKSAQEIAVYSEEFFSQFGSDAVWCEGNHDGNCIGLRIVLDNGLDTADNYNKYLVPDSVLFDKTIKYVDGAHFDEDALAAVDNVGYTAEQLANVKAFLKMCYYVDDTVNKIRFIVIDTGVGAVAENIYMGYIYAQSNKLFFKTLIKFLSSTPGGYDVVVCGHMLVWNNISQDFSPIISAFKVGANTVKLEDWTWKSFDGVPVYMSPIDFQIKEASPLVGDKAYVLDLNALYGILFNVYVCETTGIWRKTSELFAKTYATLSNLEESWPNPKIGYFAYVGGYTDNTYNYKKYICRTDGTWEDSGESITSSSNPIVYGSNSVLVNAVSPELARGSFFDLHFDGTKFNNRIFTVSGHWHISGAFISQPNTDISEGGLVHTRDYTNLIDYESVTPRTNGAILNIIVEDACLKNDGVPFPDTSSEVHRKTLNTLEEQAFDVITITEDNRIVCTRFGAGTDRSFSL